MSWIESHQTLRSHPKTRKLARLLGVRLPEAIGILHCLWWWTLDYADDSEDGSLAKFDNEDIAFACEWDGDADVLVASLVACGFLDECEGVLYVHDWWQYAGRLLRIRQDNRDRAKKSYESRRTEGSQAGLRTGCA